MATRVCCLLSLPVQASLLSRLKHPNIVSYKESFQDRECLLHIVMGYCEGGDLSSRLQSYHGNLLPEGQVVEWFVQIALALQVYTHTRRHSSPDTLVPSLWQYLHDRNILHRDLKVRSCIMPAHIYHSHSIHRLRTSSSVRMTSSR